VSKIARAGIVGLCGVMAGEFFLDDICSFELFDFLVLGEAEQEIFEAIKRV
jgi:hypothetical protein